MKEPKSFSIMCYTDKAIASICYQEKICAEGINAARSGHISCIIKPNSFLLQVPRSLFVPYEYVCFLPSKLSGDRGIASLDTRDAIVISELHGSIFVHLSRMMLQISPRKCTCYCGQQDFSHLKLCRLYCFYQIKL